MNKNSMHKLLSFILCIVLIAAMALLATGCSDAKPTDPTNPTDPTGTASTEVIEKGEGKTAFNFHVTDQNGNTTMFLVKTDKTIVGDALLEVGLITGTKESYGLYVKSVNGITADYAKDNAYWAFYVNGEYASKGVDATTIDPNATYSFVKTPA